MPSPKTTPLPNNDPNRIELSNGVVLKIKAGSRNAISYAGRNAQKDHPQPEIPMVFIKDQERSEPNADDPDYIQAFNIWQIEISARIMDVLYAQAVIVETIPDGVGGPDSIEFKDFLELAMGEQLRASEMGRLVQWLRYWAIPDGDRLDLQRRLLQLAGVPLEDLKEVETTFPDNTGGKPDNGSADKQSG